MPLKDLADCRMQNVYQTRIDKALLGDLNIRIEQLFTSSKEPRIVQHRGKRKSVMTPKHDAIKEALECTETYASSYVDLASFLDRKRSDEQYDE